MKSDILKRGISVLLCLFTAVSLMSVSPTAGARYADDFDGTYDDLNCAEDDCDCLEPDNNRFAIVSPDSRSNTHNTIVFTGTYEQVLDYLNEKGQTDGLPVIPPTKLKAEKFMRYTPYDDNDVIAVVNGRQVTAYQVAANAIMSGSSAEYMPLCIAFTKALGNPGYLDSLRSGKLTPMMYVNGPVGRQLGVDNSQGMTTEECNIAIARFMELALINLGGIERTNPFGNVQPLVFSENEEACLNIGWEPHHVQEGYDLNDSTVTAASFSMWGNNVTPATDLPEEIMKVMAWDITEKNLGGLGSGSVRENAETRRLIFVTESVASALAARYRSKGDLESALVENARRPLWMRAYAYYYANTGGALTKTFSKVYSELGSAESEDARLTASPPWMNGVTYSEIDTVAAMTKGSADIIITGDSSRNKTQVMPGGCAVTEAVELPTAWNDLMTSMSYKPLSDFELSARDNTVNPPARLPSVLTNGTYRILDPATGSTYLTRAGRVYYDASAATLNYYAYGASARSSVALDTEADSDFITYLTDLGANSSFTVNNGKIRDVTVRFSSNASKMRTNTAALTAESFIGIPLTLHANNTANSASAGGAAKDGAVIDMSDTVTSFTVNLDGGLVTGGTTDPGFVTLNGSTVTVDPKVRAGATAIIGTPGSDGTYRTLTFTNGGDGTYTLTYNTANTLSVSESAVYLRGSFNNWSDADAFKKTGNKDVLCLTKDLSPGNYEFRVFKSGSGEGYGGGTITETANRMALTKSGGNCAIKVTGGRYEFRYELSTDRLSVFRAASGKPSLGVIAVEKVTADTVNSGRAEVDVFYSGEPIAAAQISVVSGLPVSGIRSEYDVDFDAETGRVVVYDSAGQGITGTLFTVIFEFNAVIPDGEYPVRLNVRSVTDPEDAAIMASTVSGAVIVDNDYSPGDVTQDGEVDNRDLILIARYLVRLVEFNGKQMADADYDGSGTINNTDLVLIARFLVAEG